MVENEKDIDALKKELEQLMREFGGLQKQSDENIEKIESFLPEKEAPKVEVKKEVQKEDKKVEKSVITPEPTEKKTKSKSDFDSEMERLFYPNRTEKKEKTSEPKKPVEQKSEIPKVEPKKTESLKPITKTSKTEQPKTPVNPIITKQEIPIKVKEIKKEIPKVSSQIKKTEPIKSAPKQMSSMEKLRFQMEANDKKEAADKLKKEVKLVTKVAEIKKPISTKTPIISKKTKPTTLKAEEVKTVKSTPSVKPKTQVKKKQKSSLGFYLKVFLWSLFIYLAVVIGYLYFTKNQYFLEFVDKTFGTTLTVNSNKINQADTGETLDLNSETETTNTVTSDSISATEADLSEEIELP